MEIWIQNLNILHNVNKSCMTIAWIIQDMQHMGGGNETNNLSIIYTNKRMQPQIPLAGACVKSGAHWPSGPHMTHVRRTG